MRTVRRLLVVMTAVVGLLLAVGASASAIQQWDDTNPYTTANPWNFACGNEDAKYEGAGTVVSLYKTFSGGRHIEGALTPSLDNHTCLTEWPWGTRLKTDVPYVYVQMSVHRTTGDLRTSWDNCWYLPDNLSPYSDYGLQEKANPDWARVEIRFHQGGCTGTVIYSAVSSAYFALYV